MNSDEVIDKIAATAGNVKWTDFTKVASIFLSTCHFVHC